MRRGPGTTAVGAAAARAGGAVEIVGAPAPETVAAVVAGATVPVVLEAGVLIWAGAAATGGGAATVGLLGGGAAFAAASACLRSRIAFSASPGFAAFDRSIFGTACCCLAPVPCDRLPPLI